MTNLFSMARNAALITLALGTIAAGVAPAEALSLKQLPEAGSSDRHDCDSRRDVAYYFKTKGLRDISVQRVSHDELFKVSGYYKVSEQPALVSRDMESGKSGKIRYVAIYDACDHRVVEQIRPRES